MNASDWIGIGVIALVIVGVLILLNQITKPYDVKTEEEFQKRRKESAGMMVAGLKGLQQMLTPPKERPRSCSRTFSGDCTTIRKRPTIRRKRALRPTLEHVGIAPMSDKL